MKSQLRSLIFFFGLSSLLSVNALADSKDSVYQMSFKKEESRDQFQGGMEYTSLANSTTDSALTGMGIRLGYMRALSNRWGLNFNLAQIFSFSNGFSFQSTGISAFARFCLIGRLIRRSAEASIKEETVFRQESHPKSLLYVGAGAEQLFINGSSQVFPAAGIAAQLGYEFKMFGSWWTAEARYSILSGNNASITGISANLSIVFGL